MRNKREILYHIVFWLLFLGLDQLLKSITSDKETYSVWGITIGTGFVVLQIIIFYINYALICPNTVPYKRWKSLIAAQFALILLFPAIRYIVEEVILYHITGFHNYDTQDLSPLYYIYDNSYYSIRILLFSLIGYFLKYLWNTSAKLNQLIIEKKQAELQSLKNQLSPHFLFNSLNGFYSDLYGVQPKVAEDILKLSEMLRYVTYESENEMVRLGDEIVFLQNYIDLFKRRFDNKVAISFIHPESPLPYSVPSLLLIHFLENALKHGVTDDDSNPVVIDLQIANESLIFTVSNKYRISENYDAKGIGHRNISQRLNIMYPGKHKFAIEQDSQFYKVTLVIPLSS